jgi:VanZ family protein
MALWLVAAACVCLTVYFSFWGSPPEANAFRGADKVGHALAYFATTLSFLLAAVWRPGRGPGRWPRAGLWFPIAAVLAGITVEIMQATLTSTRNGEIGDVVAEAIGAGLAFAAYTLIRCLGSLSQPRLRMTLGRRF